MRTKLICLMLCLVALMTVAFSSCGEAEETGTEQNEQQSARTPVSINMWVVCEKEIDPETEKAVEDAFNDLTQTMFTTKVDFIFLTEDEYFTALDDAFAQAELYKLTHSTSTGLVGMPDETTEAVETTVEMVTNELGQQLLKYPDITDGQIDIVFLAGETRLRDYADAGKILSIEEKLNSSDAKDIYNCVDPNLLKQIKIKTATSNTAQAYAVPNRSVVGEYTYMLVNKDLLEDYYFHIDDINTFADCAEFVTALGESGSSVAPVLEYVDPVNMQYWLNFIPAVDNGPELTFAIGDAATDSTEAEPYVNNDVIMVPLINFVKDLGGTYKEDPTTRVATYTYGTRTVVVTPGEMTAMVNGESVQLAATPVYNAEKFALYAPIDFVVDTLCAEYAFDEATGEYVVNTKTYDMSTIASYYAGDASLGTGDRIEMKSLFAIPEFTDHMVLMEKCRENGWFAEDPANTTDFGVAILTGSRESMMKYEEEGKYAVKVLSNPIVDEEDVFDSMFAVTSYTVNVDRALEVLTLIYTNTEANNILKYGVEGKHFEFDDNGQFAVISDDYAINPDFIGNSFLNYTEDEVSEDAWADSRETNLPVAEVWEDAWKTNADSRVYPFFGLKASWSTLSMNELDKLRKISNVMIDEMEKCTSSEELAEFFVNAEAELALCVDFQSAIGNAPETEATVTEDGEPIVKIPSPYDVYNAWVDTVWPKSTKPTAGNKDSQKDPDVHEITCDDVKSAAEKAAETATVIPVQNPAEETTAEVVAE